MEKWRPIKEYPGYMVSTKGRVFSLKSGQYMKQYARGIKKGGCWRDVVVCLGNKKISVARLVLMTFRRPPREKEVVRFLDDNDCNVQLENLVWETRSEQSTRVSRKGKFGPRYFRKRVFALATDPTYEGAEYE